MDKTTQWQIDDMNQFADWLTSINSDKDKIQYYRDVAQKLSGDTDPELLDRIKKYLGKADEISS